MRQKYSVFLALPVANALSLANFQSISLASIPLLCQLTYDGQIPSCVVSDFNTGCTPACVAGLNSIAADVISACAGIHVTSNSLLGIIQNGGIQAALCPTLAKVTTTSKVKTTSTVQASTTPAIVSVTLPTDSIGVTGGLGFKTSSSTSVKSTSAPRASTTISIKSTSKTIESASTIDSSTSSETSSSVESAATESSQTTFATTTSARGSIQTSTSSSSSKATTTTKAQPNTGVSGGGSPFDIQSSAERIGGKSMLGLLILAAWTGVLLGR